jgi:sulfate permease, SulP family
MSAPVLAGFKAGTGLLIISGQLGKVLGIEQTGDNFFQKSWSALEHLSEVDWRTAAVAAATLLLLIGAKRWAPRSFPVRSRRWRSGSSSVRCSTSKTGV